MKNNFCLKRTHPPVWQHDYHTLKKLFFSLSYLRDKYLKKKSEVILDYGCGSLPYKNLFINYTKQYIGIDLPSNKKADIKVDKDKKIPLKNNIADLIISTQVIEHVENVDFYLQECHRLLKKGGLLMLSTHGVWPYHQYPSDFHRWTRKGLEIILENYKIKCQETISILGPFASITQFTLIIIAEKLSNKNIIAKILIVIFSLVGNCIIWLENKLFPPTEESDASVYVICAKKI